MATPTIIIGIGTSGLYTLENAQRFYYETMGKKDGKNKPDNVEFIYLETNEHNRPTPTPIGNNITRVYISLDDMADMVKEIKATCNNPSWLPDERVVMSAGLGAGGIRACGRLALWGTNKQGANFTNFQRAVENAHARVVNVTKDAPTNDPNKTKTEKISVFVTGSLTGGTGSGVFIDTGYLVQHIIGSNTEVYGLFLLPKRPITMKGHEVMYGNAYGAIKDLEYYNKIENTYSEKWPNGFTKNEVGKPFVFSQYISQDYQDGTPAISNLSGLYKMAGLYLFLNIAGIYEKRRERLVDSSSNSLIGDYGTFGLSAIQFPKDQIQEFVSSQLSIDLLSRLIDSDNYFINGQQRKIVRASIKQNMAEVFDGILESAFESLNVMGDGKNLLASIDIDATKINKNEIQGSPTDFIVAMFTSSRNNNYHALVNNNIKTAMNVFIDNIYQQVDNALQKSENLYYAKYVLEDIVESIERTLAYWKQIGLSSQPEKWDNELRKLAIACTNNTYKSVFEHDTVLKDRLNTIFELMKMHLSIRGLVDICKHVKEGRIRLEGGSHELPKTDFFDDLIKRISALMGKNSFADNIHNLSFVRRLDDIKADVNDTTLPILRVYPTNSFERECENSLEVYNQKNGTKVRKMADVIDQQNILIYLKRKVSGKFYEEIYLDFLRAFRIKIETLGCIEDFNVSEYIRNNVPNSISTAKRATSPFLKISKVLPPIPSIPRFIIGDNINEVGNVISAFSGQNFNDFLDTTDGKMELKDLKNIIVFYDEKGNFSVKNDLSYISLMSEAFENVPTGLSDDNITKERWIANRSAYKTN